MVKLTESDATSSVTSRYLHLGQAPLVMERGGQIRFFGTDPHADVVYLANGSGTLVGDHSYSPWGEKRTASGEDPRFEFQGDLRDEDTGLVDMGARLYSPELGRFTTTDPLRGEADRPITLNRYTYGLDNPVSNVDPTGLYVPQYGHQDRGTKTSPKRAQTASIGPSTSNVAASTRTSSASGVTRAEQTHHSPAPRPTAVAARRSTTATFLHAMVHGFPVMGPPSKEQMRRVRALRAGSDNGHGDLIAKIILGTMGGIVVVGVVGGGQHSSRPDVRGLRPLDRASPTELHPRLPLQKRRTTPLRKQRMGSREQRRA